MLARVIVAAILFMTLAHQIASQTAPVTSTSSLNATVGLNSNITFTPTAGALPQAVYYQLSWNVSDATSVNVTVDIYVNDVSKGITHDSKSTALPSETVSETSGLLDPCVASVSEKDSVAVNFVAVTDGLSGEATLTSGTVEIPAIQNGVATDLKCGVQTTLGNPCLSYYTAEITVAEGATWYLYGQASTTAEVALGTSDACPSVYQTLGATTPILLLNVTSNTTFWVAVNATSSLAMPQLTLTWNPFVMAPPVAPTASAPVPEAPQSPPQPEEPMPETPATNEPVTATPESTTPESGPVSAPSGDDDKALPQWALALLVVFGLLIGVLLIVVIVLCVKNRRRASYNTVA